MQCTDKGLSSAFVAVLGVDMLSSSLCAPRFLLPHIVLTKTRRAREFRATVRIFVSDLPSPLSSDLHHLAITSDGTNSLLQAFVVNAHQPIVDGRIVPRSLAVSTDSSPLLQHTKEARCRLKRTKEACKQGLVSPCFPSTTLFPPRILSLSRRIHGNVGISLAKGHCRWPSDHRRRIWDHERYASHSALSSVQEAFALSERLRVKLTALN